MSTDRSFPGFDAIFRLRQPAGTDDFEVIDENWRAHLRPNIRRGNAIPKEPVELRYHFGRKLPGDLVWEQHGQLLVSGRVVECFRERGFTGWLPYPVRVYGKEGEQIEGLHGLAITGTCGFIDYRMSEDTIQEFYGRKIRRFVGTYFDPDTWDGSDLFMPAETNIRFMLALVRDALNQFDLVGSTFEALPDHEALPADVRRKLRLLRQMGYDPGEIDV